MEGMDVEGYSDIDKMIGEFVLRRLDDTGACGVRILSMLRLREDDDCMTLKKLAVLGDVHVRRIRAMVDEKVLDLLEMFEKLQLQEGSAILESLKSAYCSVAVECMVKCILPLETPGSSSFSHLLRMWDHKIGDLKDRESELVTQELVDWVNDLKNSFEDHELYQRIRETNHSRFTAYVRLRDFVKEQWELMGPPSLEVEANRWLQAKGNDTEAEDPNGSERENRDGVGNGENVQSPSDPNEQRGLGDGEAMAGQQEQKCEQVETTVAQELKNDLVEMEALIDSLTAAAGNGQTSEPFQDVTAGGGDLSNESENADEGVSSDDEGTSSKRVRPSLPNPEPLNVSPLRKHGMPKPQSTSTRRLRRNWTPEEVEALKEGVKEYGKSWKAIKEAFPETFADRSQVDLKDKWRNLVE